MPKLPSELAEFDWFNFKSTAPAKAFKFEPISIMQIQKPETEYERKLRMLRQVSTACLACSMCELGLKPAEKNNEERDPHVFSTLNPVRFMLVGQNPGWDELKVRQPFVGAAGKIFDAEIAKHSITRDDFYICNTVRCFTQNNTKPSEMHKERCEPFLRIEINIIRPQLVICLGAVAFSQFCPEHDFTGSFHKITKSKKYDVNVYPIYHPSPLNFASEGRREVFELQIKNLCKLIKVLKTR